jgi:hypothetical protein
MKWPLETDPNVLFPYTGSTISTEPMYIIMNTAVSKEWGFPSQCPSNCPCKEYDCNSQKFAETCGFSANFCDMMTNKTAVPSYKVNWVRVYQDPKNPKQKVGCSTPERPTKKYIEAHEHMYKTANDVSVSVSSELHVASCLVSIMFCSIMFCYILSCPMMKCSECYIACFRLNSLLARSK